MLRQQVNLCEKKKKIDLGRRRRRAVWAAVRGAKQGEGGAKKKWVMCCVRNAYCTCSAGLTVALTAAADNGDGKQHNSGRTMNKSNGHAKRGQRASGRDIRRRRRRARGWRPSSHGRLAAKVTSGLRWNGSYFFSPLPVKPQGAPAALAPFKPHALLRFGQAPPANQQRPSSSRLF